MTTTRRLHLWSLAGIGCLTVVAAAAQEGSSYIYGGLSAGQSRARIDDERINAGLLNLGLATTGMSRDERDVGYKLFGGYQWNRHVGVEGGYFNLGEFGFRSTTVPTGTLDGRIKLQGVNLDVVGTWPLNERFSLIGRVGAQHARARDTFVGTGAVSVFEPTPRKSEINPKLGVGVQYELGRSLLVRGEAERYRINDAVGNHGGINVFSLSLVFPLGRAPLSSARAAAPPVPAARPADPPAPPTAVVVAPTVPPAPLPAPIASAPRRVSFSADSLFAFDRAEVRPESRAALDGFVRELKGTRFDVVTVEGHTDRLGSEAYNEALSRRRAEAVKAYLVGTGGLEPARVSAVGKGESSPVTRPQDCGDRTAKAAQLACLQPDRRVVVEVAGTR